MSRGRRFAFPALPSEDSVATQNYFDEHEGAASRNYTASPTSYDTFSATGLGFAVPASTSMTDLGPLSNPAYDLRPRKRRNRRLSEREADPPDSFIASTSESSLSPPASTSLSYFDTSEYTFPDYGMYREKKSKKLEKAPSNPNKYMLSSSVYGPVSLPPRSYSDMSPFEQPVKKLPIFASQIERLPGLSERMDCLELATEKIVVNRGQRAICNSVLPGLQPVDVDYSPPMSRQSSQLFQIPVSTSSPPARSSYTSASANLCDLPSPSSSTSNPRDRGFPTNVFTVKSRCLFSS